MHSITGVLLGQAQRCVGMGRTTNPYTFPWCNLLLSVLRMGALARIAALNKRHIEDTVQRNVELQERKRALEKENKLKNFMLTKSRDRSELEEVAKKRKGTR